MLIKDKREGSQVFYVIGDVGDIEKRVGVLFVINYRKFGKELYFFFFLCGGFLGDDIYIFYRFRIDYCVY